MSDLDETRGIALVGMALGLILLTSLHYKGIITTKDQDDILEGLLSGLEVFQPATDPGVQKARQLVDAMTAIVVAKRKPQSEIQ